MSEHLKNLSLSEVEGKEKMMVVRVSLDLCNLIYENAESAGVTVSGLVRSILAFNYYPDLLTLALGTARAELAETLKGEGYEGLLSEYEEKLIRLSAEAEVFMQVLSEEEKRVKNAHKQVREILEEFVLDGE